VLLIASKAQIQALLNLLPSLYELASFNPGGFMLAFPVLKY
jgi:hypothetical protein